MRALDIFSYSFSAIKLRKLRAALTTLGVIIGIGAIVALLSITTGLQTSITGQLSQGLSANTLIVVPGGGTSNDQGQGVSVALGGGTSGSTSGFKLYANYTSEINALSSDINTSFAVISRPGYIISPTYNRSVTLNGVDFEAYSQVYPTTFVAESGTIPTNPANDDIVIGSRVTDPRENGTMFYSAGDNVDVSWLNATVLPPVNETYAAHISAVMPKIGGFGFGGPSDTGVYIPLSQAESFFNTSECDMIIVQLKTTDPYVINATSNLITQHFSNQVTVVSASAVISLLSSVFSVLSLFLAGIAAISLLVAGIGIMNIMIVSLMERTREIGILKALGMKSRTVLTIFLGESVIIGLIGAVIGIASGWGLAIVVTQVLGTGLFGGGGAGSFNVVPVLTPEVALGALAFGVGVSVIFALYPAWRASKLKPVEALRYE